MAAGPDSSRAGESWLPLKLASSAGLPQGQFWGAWPGSRKMALEREQTRTIMSVSIFLVFVLILFFFLELSELWVSSLNILSAFSIIITIFFCSLMFFKKPEEYLSK